jgi:hypothetical protein
MDEGQAGAASSSGAAGETALPDASASGHPGLQDQQQQQTQQLASPIAGARNYGYPDDFIMYVFKVGSVVWALLFVCFWVGSVVREASLQALHSFMRHAACRDSWIPTDTGRATEDSS